MSSATRRMQSGGDARQGDARDLREMVEALECVLATLSIGRGELKGPPAGSPPGPSPTLSGAWFTLGEETTGKLPNLWDRQG